MKKTAWFLLGLLIALAHTHVNALSPTSFTQSATQQHSFLGNATLEKIIALNQTGAFTQALDLIKQQFPSIKTSELNPNLKARLWHQRAFALKHLKKYAQAEKSLRNALALNDLEPTIHGILYAELIQVYNLMEEFTKALDIVEQALQLHNLPIKSLGIIRKEQLFALYQLQQWDQSAQLLIAIKAHHPNLPQDVWIELYYIEMLINIEQNQLPTAIDLGYQVLDLVPSLETQKDLSDLIDNTIRELALLLYRQQRREEVLSLIENSLRDQKLGSLTIGELKTIAAGVYLDWNKPQKALAHLQAVIELGLDDPEVMTKTYALKAEALAMQQQYEAALIQARIALSFNDDTRLFRADLFRFLSEVCSKLGRHKEALLYWIQYNLFHPESQTPYPQIQNITLGDWKELLPKALAAYLSARLTSPEQANIFDLESVLGLSLNQLFSTSAVRTTLKQTLSWTWLLETLNQILLEAPDNAAQQALTQYLILQITHVYRPAPIQQSDADLLQRLIKTLKIQATDQPDLARLHAHLQEQFDQLQDSAQMPPKSNLQKHRAASAASSETSALLRFPSLRPHAFLAAIPASTAPGAFEWNAFPKDDLRQRLSSAPTLTPQQQARVPELLAQVQFRVKTAQESAHNAAALFNSWHNGIPEVVFDERFGSLPQALQNMLILNELFQLIFAQPDASNRFVQAENADLQIELASIISVALAVPAEQFAAFVAMLPENMELSFNLSGSETITLDQLLQILQQQELRAELLRFVQENNLLQTDDLFASIQPVVGMELFTAHNIAVLKAA